jgi:hypothetical protein
LGQEPIMPLAATLEVPAGQTDPAAFQVILRITNPTVPSVAILNPDMGVPAPAMNWPFSNEVYQTAMLLSFGYLALLVSDETGAPLPQQPIQTWATPVILPKLTLAPGDSLALVIPLGAFYELVSGCDYEAVVEYGDKDLKVAARTRFAVP